MCYQINCELRVVVSTIHLSTQDSCQCLVTVDVRYLLARFYLDDSRYRWPLRSRFKSSKSDELETNQSSAQDQFIALLNLTEAWENALEGLCKRLPIATRGP